MSADQDPPIYLSTLQNRREVAERTMAFHFEKPRGFHFIPGQFTEVTLRNPAETDSEGNTRTFSIASDPDEDFVMITTRMQNTAFKRVLGSMPLGTEVTLKGASGDLTLHEDSRRPAAILAGGIGITPFRAMVVHAARHRFPHRIFLFYSNRRPEDAPFLDELERLEQENPHYKLIATMTQMEKSRQPWQGERGTIDPTLLSRHLSNASSPVYYIAGPPEMVRALQTMLQGAGIDEASIRTEEFDGY